MAANTRIKVKRTVLLEKLQGSKAQAVELYERAVVEYDAAIVAWRKQVDEAVKAFAKAWDASDEDLYESHWAGNRRGGYIKVDVPQRPEAPSCNTSKLDYMVRILEASEDETISISADDDYARYL